MCEPATLATIAAITGIAGAGMSAIGSYQQGQATKKANEFNAEVYKGNAAIANKNAANERQQGIEDARQIRAMTIQKMAAQQAAVAANGLDINEGTSVDLTAGTSEMGELDALTTMHNAEKRAVNYENNARDYLSQAKLSLMSGKNAAISGALSGLGEGMQGVSLVSSKWSGYDTFGKISTNKTSTGNTWKP